MRARTVITFLSLGASLLQGPASSAQSTQGLEDTFPDSELDDPIGVDRSSRALETAGIAPPPNQEAQRAAREEFGPMPPPLRAQAGEVLVANRAVKESQHRVRTTLLGDLAMVETVMRFETTAKTPSEIRYRLATPADAGLAGLEVCGPTGCREGLAVPIGGGLDAYDDAVHARGADAPLPVAHARQVRDKRGAGIVVRAAPVTRDAELEVRVRYLAATPLHGGRARLWLPPRGMDPRVAPAEVELDLTGARASRLVDARIDGQPAKGPARIDPWAGVELSASMAAGAAPPPTAYAFPCGDKRCMHASASAGPAALKPVDLLVALDVSPSTEGPARSRLLPTLAALLAAAPEGSRVRALAFAGKTEAIISKPTAATDVVLTPFGRAVERSDLGSATRFEAAWGTLARWLRGKGRRRDLSPLVVILGDGGLTVGDARPFEAARRSHVTVSALNVDDRKSVAELRRRVLRTGGLVVDAGAEADDAARGRGSRALEERVGALFAPTAAREVQVRTGRATTTLGGLRAGESLSWDGVAPSGALTVSGKGRARARRPPGALAIGLANRFAHTQAGDGAARALAAIDPRDLKLAGKGWAPRPSKRRCDRRGPARRHSGVSTDAAPVALAEARTCKKPPKASTGSHQDVGVGMPSDPLLDMLRLRIIPVARGCFRRDRAGRADYSVRAVFHFRLAEREVVEARVEGAIAPALAECLLTAVDGLEVPRFSGVVNVRYPLRTLREQLPPTVELGSDTARQVDALIRKKPAP